MIERLHVSHRQLLSKLPEDGTPGATQYRPPGETPPVEAAARGIGTRRDIADYFQLLTRRLAPDLDLLDPAGHPFCLCA